MKKLLVLFCVIALAGPAFAQVTMRVANGSAVESIDPSQISGVQSARVYWALFEGLVIYDPKDASPIPGVAESWSANADQTVFTFKIRKGITWSDGTPITAQTVVDSWLRTLNPETGSEYASSIVDVIKGAADYNTGKAPASAVAVKAVDASTFQFTATSAKPYAIAQLAHHSFAIVPMHAIAKYGKDWILPQNFVGNGPFVLKEYSPQEKIVVAKNPRYWDAANVKVDQIVYFSSEDLATTYNMYLNAEVDYNTNNPPPEKIEEAKLRKDFQNSKQLGTYYYEFAAMRKPFSDPRVRKAFAMAINRQELVEKITRGGQIPAFTYFPTTTGYPSPKGLAEDKEAAKKLLADAGYPGGKGLPVLKLGYNTSASHKKIAEYLQQTWQQVLGAQIELTNVEFATFLTQRKDGNLGGFDIARAGWIGDFMDPWNFLYMFLSDNLDFNDPRWSNPQYDTLVRKANTMPAGMERNKVFAQAERFLVEQDLPIMPIYFYTTQEMIDTNKWGGYYQNLLNVHEPKFFVKK